MIFPFSVHFKRALKALVTSDNKGPILQYIRESVLKDKADNVVVEYMAVRYSGSTSIWRISLFGSVDNGIFCLTHENNRWFLSYQINMGKLFITTSILSTNMGVFSLVNGGPWWVGVAAFLWLCGANWIINLIRHGAIATEIALGIDELICSETELPIEDKMTGKLKSWF
jgi:hypothetical protein